MARDAKPSWPFGVNYGSSQALGLVGWWPMEPIGNITLYDLAPRNQHHGTLQQFSLTQTGGWSYGYEGGHSLAFDGTNDYVDMGVPSRTGSLNFGDVNFTVSLWVQDYNATTGGFYLDKGATTPGGYAIRADGTGSKPSFVSIGASITSTALSGIAINNGKWHHLCGFYQGGTKFMTIFVDGRQAVATVTAIAANDVNNTASLQIGAAAGANFVKACRIEDVRIYNRVLSGREVWGLYDPMTRWQLRWQPNRVKWFLRPTPPNVLLRRRRMASC